MIRFAKREELEKVNELRKQVNDVHINGRADFFRTDFSDELREYIYTYYDRDDTDVIICIRDGVICGFASVDYVYKPMSPYMSSRKFYHINEFGTDEKYRRQGVATEMFNFIKNHAKEKGFEKIELDMWEFNEGALKFYESVGFKTYRRYMEYMEK